MRRSLRVSSWPIPVRWTFAGLLGYLDDSGRGIDDTRLVKAELYPLDDDMSARKVGQHLDRIADDGGPLCRYEVDGRSYLHVTTWAEHQKISHPAPSRVPPCPHHDGSGVTPEPLRKLPEPDQSLPEKPSASRTPAEQGAGSREQGGGAGSLEQGCDADVAEPGKPKRATTIRTDWQPTAEQVTWLTAKCPAVHGRTETQQWQDWHLAKGDVAKDWDASWRTWMRKAQSYAERDTAVPVLRSLSNPKTPWKEWG